MPKDKAGNLVHWLSEEDYAKAVGTLRLQVGAVLQPFNTMGLQVFVPEAIETLVRLCEDFGLRVRGVDKPISLEVIERKRGWSVGGDSLL